MFDFGSGDSAEGDSMTFAPGWKDESCDYDYRPLCEKSCEGCTLDHGKFD